MKDIKITAIIVAIYLLLMAYIMVCIVDLQCTPKMEFWNIFRIFAIMKGANK